MSSSSLTSYLTQRGVDKLKGLLSGKTAEEDIKEALQRLDQLTRDGLRNVAPQALGVVRARRETPSNFSLTSPEHPSLGVPEDTSTFCR